MRSFILYPQNRSFIEGKTPYSPKAPDIVDYVMSFKFVVTFIGMIVVFFLLTNPMLAYMYEHFEIEGKGVVTQGIVSSVRRSSGLRSRSSWLCYDFYVNNSHYDDCTLVKYAVAPLYPVDTVIDILYVPDNPNISRFVQGESQALESVLLICIFVFSFFVMSLGIIYTYSFIKRTNRFNNKGVILKARLDTFKSQKVFTAYVIEITVTFRLPNTTTLVSGKKQYTCNHIKEKPIPPSEAVAYILFVNKKMWEIL
ncbi:MAG TPA: hypothetical protein PLZ51_00825 [Aggregatilineales bacterium]|nr:hypothetical protein [Aggregatilineales bacterium]